MPLCHPFAPVVDASATVLILGSFPSVKSRESGFYYGNAQNRFWRVMAFVVDEPVPKTTQEKEALLKRHGIALWDVAARCDIKGSGDATMKNVMLNDLTAVFRVASIRAVFLNGRMAEKLYAKGKKQENVPAIALPSTSPANASWTLEKLCAHWQREMGTFLFR